MIRDPFLARGVGCGERRYLKYIGNAVAIAIGSIGVCIVDIDFVGVGETVGVGIAIIDQGIGPG